MRVLNLGSERCCMMASGLAWRSLMVEMKLGSLVKSFVRGSLSNLAKMSGASIAHLKQILFKSVQEM